MGTDLFNLSDDYESKHRARIRAELVKAKLLGEKVEKEGTSDQSQIRPAPRGVNIGTSDSESVATEPTRVEEYSTQLYSLMVADVHRKGAYSSIAEAAKDSDFQQERMKVWNRRKVRDAPISRAMQSQIFESVDRIIEAQEVISGGGDPSSVSGITEYEKSIAQGSSEMLSNYGEDGMAEFEDNVIEDQLPERSGGTAEDSMFGAGMRPKSETLQIAKDNYKIIFSYQDREAALDQMLEQATTDDQIESVNSIRRMVEFEDALVAHINDNGLNVDEALSDGGLLNDLQRRFSLLPSEVQFVIDSILEGYDTEENE